MPTTNTSPPGKPRTHEVSETLLRSHADDRDTRRNPAASGVQQAVPLGHYGSRRGDGVTLVYEAIAHRPAPEGISQ